MPALRTRYLAFSTISTRRQRFILDSGRVSMMRTVSPLSLIHIYGHGHAAALRELGSELVEGYAGNRHVGTEAVERKDSQREEDLLAQLRNLEAVSYTHLDVYKRQSKYGIGSRPHWL